MSKNLSTIFFLTTISAAIVSCEKENTMLPPRQISDGNTITLNGGTGGANAVNSVYVGFITGKQDSVKRLGWDLGFYCGADFKVIINNTTAASAKATTKTDISAITTADTAGFADELMLGNGYGTMAIIDDVEGDLTKTVFAPISANDADNKVYVVCPSNGFIAAAKDWYKVRVTRNGGGYRVQYAKLSETTIKTIDVSKDAAYNFRFVSFDNNQIVPVEPEKETWDIHWSVTTYLFPPDLPFTYSDFVYINYLAGVEAAEVLNTTVTYANYSEANIATTTFSNSKTAIGSKWRATTPTASASVKTDRFYVIKDAAGNIYKLKFISFTSTDGGQRGKPVIEYKLVKPAK